MNTVAADSPSCSLPRRGSWSRQLVRAGVFGGLLLAAILSLPAAARAWGCEGHQVAALVAEKHLAAHVHARVEKILAEGPIDPSLSRFCKEGGIDAMADGSTWADDIRAQRPETAPWHYVDIPLGTQHREIQKYCDPRAGCVTRAINDQLAVLRSSKADPQKRADALRFLIHFVGDLHQPLHAATNNDEGGNCVPVAFFGELPQLRNPQNASYAPNLHGVWDVGLLAKATMGETVEQVAAGLDRSFGKEIVRWQRGAADLDAWAWESYQLAARDAYGKLPAHISVETPQPVMSCTDDNHIAQRMLKLNERLGDGYQNRTAPIVRERLAQAGARLALLLNQLWP